MKYEGRGFERRQRDIYHEALSYQEQCIQFMNEAPSGQTVALLPATPEDKEEMVKKLLDLYYFSDCGIEDWDAGMERNSQYEKYRKSAQSLKGNVIEFFGMRKTAALKILYSA